MFSIPQRTSQPSRGARAGERRGAVLVLSALLIVFLIGVIAFAIDLGYMTLTRTELQASVDTAAFAGAGQMGFGTAAATTEALNYLSQNKVGGRTLTAANATIEYGTWNELTRTFTASAGLTQPSAIRVTANNNNQPTFFANIFGISSFNTTASAVAVYQPRDIALVLDYSGSMCYDSQFRSLNLLGKAAIEANLLQIYQQLGSPTYGTLTFQPVAYGKSDTKNSSVLKNFKLDKVAYPYPGGSWDEYVDHVQENSYVNSAGYRNCYGYLTWLDYIMAKRCGASNTPGLHAVSQQPVTALKDAVDVFLSYLQANSTEDRVSLSIYSFSDNTAVLEHGLTKVYSTISNTVRARQAGHYVGGTNISAGMTKARLDLIANGRPGALRLMVVMTDGVVNLPTGNTTLDKAVCVTEANLAKAAGIPIVAISLGAYADTALMAQLAQITGGVAFVVPGGQPIANIEAQLQQVFSQVASDRPLKLVQ